ncbi:MAG: carboxypeptidase-like regulatory domain-containing protein [Cyanothece sp. SIO1E1]|nr:carboxypeptidase-like regulatory domain-containing protein [Cyanothece sp. SIO1E1]
MSNPFSSFPKYLQIGLIIIAVFGTGTSALFGLKTSFAPKEESVEQLFKIIEFNILDDETREPLGGVNIYIGTSVGPPNEEKTDNNGYASLKIPTQEEVRIGLRKDGYKTEDRYIDLRVDQRLKHKFYLKKEENLISDPPNEKAIPKSRGSEAVEGHLNNPSITQLAPPPSIEDLEPKKPESEIENSQKTLDTKCNAIGLEVHNIAADVPIGRKLLRAPSFVKTGGPGLGSATCRISRNPTRDTIDTLHWEFGIIDGENCSYKVSLYLDGNFAASQTVRSGESKALQVDMSNASNYHAEFLSDGGPCDLFFFKRTIESVPRGR